MKTDKSNFCTLFDHNYMSRGIVLYESLIKNFPSAKLHILCLSDECYSYLKEQSYPGIFVTNLSELEEQDAELLSVKNSRSWVEYIFTLSPCFPLFLLKKRTDIEVLTMVDADAQFFSDPTEALRQMDTSSVGITAHRFPERIKRLEIFGKYNVGFQSFRNDKKGIAALSWWREKCLEWCCDIAEEDRFADQKYLDEFPKLFGAIEFSSKGLNVAPWNIDLYAFSIENGKIFVGDEPLVFFHFQGTKPTHYKNWWTVGLEFYNSKMTDILKNFVFTPYIKYLIETSVKIERPIDSKNIRNVCTNEKTLLGLIKLITRPFRSWFYSQKRKLREIWINIPTDDTRN